MGADPVFILLTLLAAVLIGYWMTHQARKKRHRPLPRTPGLRPPAAEPTGGKRDMIQELKAELDRLEAALQPQDPSGPGPQAHVLQSLRLISTQLGQLHRRLEVLEQKAADERRLQQQYEKP